MACTHDLQAAVAWRRTPPADIIRSTALRSCQARLRNMATFHVPSAPNSPTTPDKSVLLELSNTHNDREDSENAFSDGDNGSSYFFDDQNEDSDGTTD